MGKTLSLTEIALHPGWLYDAIHCYEENNLTLPQKFKGSKLKKRSFPYYIEMIENLGFPTYENVKLSVSKIFQIIIKNLKAW